MNRSTDILAAGGHGVVGRRIAAGDHAAFRGRVLIAGRDEQRAAAVSIEIGHGMPAGTTRALEFVADNPGDWPLHCHKTHHAMNVMEHDIPNVIRVDQLELQKKLDVLVPGAMAMGSLWGWASERNGGRCRRVPGACLLRPEDGRKDR